MIRKTYQGSGYLDEKLMDYRKHRKTIQSENPYYFMGEPIGKMRDQMECQNENLSTNITQWETIIAGMACSFYERENQRQKEERACVIFFHGGAFLAGSRQVVENPCRLLTQLSDALVINVEYPLAPEHHLLSMTKTIAEGILQILEDSTILFNRHRVFLSGDSAGANLVLSTVLQYPHLQEKIPFQGLLLYYPVVDLTNTQTLWKWKENEIRGSGETLVDHCMRSLVGLEEQSEKLYVQGNLPMDHPFVSPLYAKDVSVLPKLCIIYAEYDYLRFQIEAFVSHLQNFQKEVKSICYEGVNHAFLNLLGRIDQAADAIVEGSTFINEKGETS